MAILKIRDEYGQVQEILAIRGEKGEDAYAKAKEFGYTGTEDEFYLSMVQASESVNHASKHATGGADPLTPAMIGAATADHTHTAADVGAATTETYTATVANTWTADGDHFYQDIAVNGIQAEDNPVVDINPGTDNAANKLYSEAICKVFRITTAANSIRVWATESVSTAFPIQLKVVR